MRKGLSIVAVTAVALVAAVAAFADDGGPNNNDNNNDSGNASTLAVYGDSPYGTTPTDNAQFLATPAFIDSINADSKVGLVLHVGDIHSGKQYCTQAYDLPLSRRKSRNARAPTFAGSMLRSRSRRSRERKPS